MILNPESAQVADSAAIQSNIAKYPFLNQPDF